jgi:hypothetical protein
MCTFGAGAATLMVLPLNMVDGTQMPAATIQDFIPMVNILPFGMCISPANPMFVAATAAALGVPTPVPCIPVVTSPWTPGAVNTQINHMPALHSACINTCTWGGVIMITNPGQTSIQVT